MNNFNNKGFTFIELMLAMTLFISIMVIATVGFVGINRTFSKGLVRKQLSEAVQRSVEDITRTIRSQGVLSNYSTLPDGSQGALCSTSVCYVWGDSDTGGLYRTSLSAVEDFQEGTELLDSRFIVDVLRVENISGQKMERLRGVFRTNDESAFNISRSTSGEITDPFSTTCLGTAQDGATTNCALEKFDFVVSTSIKGPEPEGSP